MAVQDKVIFEDLDLRDPNLLQREPYRHRRCSIMATLSDSQITQVDLQRMMEAGMNTARFKMSHHTKGEKIRLLDRIEKAAAACSRKHGVPSWPLAICVELKTCIVKTGILEKDDKYINIEENSEVILTCNLLCYDKCNDRKIFVDNTHLVTDVTVGKEISIGGDNVIMECTEILDTKSIKCVVKKGGKLFDLSNVCVRGISKSRPWLTKRDLHYIKFALEHQVDVITIYYVRNVETVRLVKKYIGNQVKRPLLLSGICTEQGLAQIDEIIEESDGIILSRELLPFEVEPSKKYRMNNIQKWLAAKCQKVGKPLYLIGGVFHEALSSGEFSDNEIDDVANAILDGITGFVLRDCDNIDTMLECIKVLDQMSLAIEPYTASKTQFWSIADQMKIPLNAAEACVMSCATVANQTQAQVIVLPTVTGRTAKMLFWMRPNCLVLAVCTNIRVSRMLEIYRAVKPLLYTGEPKKQFQITVQERIDYAIEFLVEKNLLSYGDTYVTLQRGTESSSFCDTVRVYKVSISNKPLVECSDDEE